MENYRKSSGQPTYEVAGARPFSQDWSDPIKNYASGWEDVSREEIMEKELLSMENEDHTREQKTHDDKCVGRYNLLETGDEEIKFEIIDEGESSENLAVDLPVIKEQDKKLIVGPEVESTDECSEEKAHFIGNKLALLMNVFRKVDQVGGPHKLAEDDCKKFKKQLAVYMPGIDDDEVEVGFDVYSFTNEDDIDLVNADGMLMEPKKRLTYRIVDGIVDEICDLALEDTNETDTL